MRRECRGEPRRLVIQLARLGDVVQTLPALDALRQAHPHQGLDLLCPEPLTAVAAGSGLCDRVLPWDGARWHAWASRWADNPVRTLHEAEGCIESLGPLSYERVYSLNQHARCCVLAQLCAEPIRRVSDTEAWEAQLRPWAQHLRWVANERGANRVHLADAWCGMCGVLPRGQAPLCVPPAAELPDDLAGIGERRGLWVALAVGAGEADRCIAPAVWNQWIREFLAQTQDGHVVLIGSRAEGERAQAILDSLPTLLHGCVWDATGRTTLVQLMCLLQKCQWIIGADTGPLHLGTLVGTRAIGWYFSRARVHETGPYGEGHWVFQHATQTQPHSWPIMGSIALMRDEQRQSLADWTLWRSRMDRWGAFFDDGSETAAVESSRADIWRACAPVLCESMAA